MSRPKNYIIIHTHIYIHQIINENISIFQSYFFFFFGYEKNWWMLMILIWMRWRWWWLLLNILYYLLSHVQHTQYENECVCVIKKNICMNEDVVVASYICKDVYDLKDMMMMIMICQKIMILIPMQNHWGEITSRKEHKIIWI